MNLLLIHVATAARFWPFLQGQLAFLKTRGWDVEIASAPGPRLEPFALAEGVRAWTIAMTRRITPARDLLTLARLWTLFLRRRPTMVHAHTPKAGLLAMLAAWGAGVPIRFYTLHGLVWQTRRGFSRRLLIALDRLACRLAHRVVAVGPSIRRAALEASLSSPEKIVVAANGSANGLDFEAFDPARLDPARLGVLRNRYRVPEQKPVLGVVGRIAPDKGIAELAQAWDLLRRRFPSLRLLLLGEIEPHDPPPASLLKRLRRDPRVHFSGWVDDMPHHYGLIDVCVLPSRREGLPYAALEAAAMEKPLAAFDADGVRDVVENGSTGLLAPPGDAGALAGAVARLLDDPEFARRLGRQARAQALTRYRRDLVWDGLYQHYSEALLNRAVLPWWKRPLDLALAAILIVLLAPPLGLIALAVVLDLGRPLLYRQRRIGLAGRPFEILKFRTMRAVGETPLPDGVRLTRLGRLLRRWSLDELPQLLNILRGQMSFIGPRPLLERYLAAYTSEERRRHLVRPGLTGWAQIHGRNDLAWDRRLALDVWYVDHVSPRLDATIAVQTVWKILTRHGVQDDPSSLLPDLDQQRRAV